MTTCQFAYLKPAQGNRIRDTTTPTNDKINVTQPNIVSNLLDFLLTAIIEITMASMPIGKAIKGSIAIKTNAINSDINETSPRCFLKKPSFLELSGV